MRMARLHSADSISSAIAETDAVYYRVQRVERGSRVARETRAS